MDAPTLLLAASKGFVVLFIAYATYNFFIYPFYRSPLRALPGPPAGLPILGQAYNLFSGDGPNDIYLAWSKKWPKAPFIRYISVGNSEVLLVNNMAAHKEVMQSKVYSLVKPSFFKRLVGEITGVGLLFADGEEHKKQRRLLANPFSAPNIKKLLPVFTEKAGHLVQTIHNTIEKTGEKSAVLEVSSIFSKATLDIIGRTALGLELDNLSAANGVVSRPTYTFHDAYHTIFNPSAAGAIITLINMTIPVRSWLPLKANTTYVNANADLRRMLREIITERRKSAGSKVNKDVDGRDLLTFMLEERSDTWTDEEILGHLLNFLSAGHETTAGTLTWAVHAMASHPAMQDKLRAEIQTLPENYSLSEIESAPYMNAFIHETLRMWSPSFQAPRETGEDVTIAGVFIPKGTTINLNPHIMNRHPDVWGPNADSFDPERWLGEEGEGGRRDAYAFQSFINGPRMCIGKAFAVLELKTLMVALMREFTFGDVGEKVVPESKLTFRPKGGLRVRIGRVGDQ